MGQKSKNAGSKKRSPPKTVKRREVPKTVHALCSNTPKALSVLNEMLMNNTRSSLIKCRHLLRKKEQQQVFERQLKRCLIAEPTQIFYL
jgi:hypothetical protein